MVAFNLRSKGTPSQIGLGMLVAADLPNPGVQSYGFLHREFNASPHVLTVGVESDLVNWTAAGPARIFATSPSLGELTVQTTGIYDVLVCLTVQTAGVTGFFNGFITKNNLPLVGSRFTVTVDPNKTQSAVCRGLYLVSTGDVLRVRLNGLVNTTVTFPHGQFVAKQTD